MLNKTAQISVLLFLLTFAFFPLSVKAQEFTRLPLNKGSSTPQFVPGEVIVKINNQEVTESLVLEGNEDVKGLSTLAKPMQLQNNNVQAKVLNIQSRYNIKSVSTVYPITPTLEINSVEPGSSTGDSENNDLEGILKLTLDESVNVQDVVSQLNQDPNIEYAEPNYIAYASETIPQDPYFQYLWALKNTGQSIGTQIPGGTAGADTKATQAWDIIKGSPNVTVCVIDSAIKLRDSELENNLWVNTDEIPLNGVDDDNNGFIDDVNGYDFVADWGSIFGDYNTHGNFVAHQIGAESNNVGDVGIAYGVKIANLVGLDHLDGGKGSFAGIAAAIRYSVDVPQCKILNLSLGGPSNANVLQEAVNYAESKGALLVVAAGNGGDDALGDNNDTTPQYPATYANNNIIAVAATNSSNRLTSFSNYGTSSVDIAAPGKDIVIGYEEFGQDKNSIRDGTSMATPYVAGVAALVLSKNPSYNATQLRNAILNSADNNPNLSGRVAGARQLNAYKAVTYNGSGPNPSPTPTGGTQPIPTPSTTIPPELVRYDLNYDNVINIMDVIDIIKVIFR